jgi:hypothetical protein
LKAVAIDGHASIIALRAAATSGHDISALLNDDAAFVWRRAPGVERMVRGTR